MILDFQFNECLHLCKDYKDDENNCCLRICSLKQIEVLLFSTDPNMKPQVNYEGLTYSFLLSIDNDTRWEPVIRASTSRCYYDQFGTTDGYQCDVIPNSLYNVIECSYKENFLKCPNYNPNEISECKETYEFLELCYE